MEDEPEDQTPQAMEAYRAVMFGSPNGVALHQVERDPAGRLVDFRYVEVNPSFVRMAGRPRAEILNALGSTLWSGRSVGLLLKHVERSADEAAPVTFEYYVERLARHYSITVFGLGPEQFATILIDITARRGTEDRLGQLVSALDQAGESILLTDSAGRVLYVNQAFTAISGFSESEALGQLPWELLATTPPAADRDQTPLWHRILGRERWSGRAVKRRRDGKLFHTESTASAVRDEAGEISHYVMIDRDITAHLEMEARLQQASKLEAIGQLAGGLAHDFNNMLTVISGHRELLAELLRADGLLERMPHAATDLQQIGDAVERAVTLTQRLLVFSRRERSQPRIVALNETISGVHGFLRRLLGEAVDVQLDLGHDLGYVKVDPAQIEQVIMNLATNARDAMEGRGKLVLGTSLVHLDRDYAERFPEVVPGHYLRLTVTDDGCGMDEAISNRIFEPFFTTKAAGAGTGLGMAVVHGIVGQNEGHIHCYSEPGRGTTFSVYFPVVDEVPRDVAGPQLTPHRGGDERILLVEDDHAVRQLTVRALATAGYQVTEAATGEEALAVTARPDLLITDLTLGDTDGLTIMEALAERWPGLHTLCVSGYPLASLGERLDTATIPHFLAKPFSPAQLRDVVREILDG